MTTASADRATTPVEVRRSGRDAWILPLVLFLATFGVFAATAERAAITNDAYAASVGAWRIATTGAPWLDGVDLQQLSGTHHELLRGSWLTEAANGHVVPHRMAGPILAGVPFYWLLGNDADAADFSLAAGGIAASALTAAAVLLVFLALRRRLTDWLALTSALVFAFATPTWSVSANGLWTHPITQLGIAGAAYALSRDRWWLAGVFLGMGMWGRPHLAVIAAIVGLGMAWSRRDLRPVLGLAAPTLSSLGLLTAWNRFLYGEWSIGGAYGDSRITQAAEGLGERYNQWTNYLGFLVSGDRGFLVWSPIVILLLPAVVRSWKALPVWTKWLALGGLLYSIFQMRLNYFAGGEGFHAYRHGLELLVCLVPMLAFSLPRAGRVVRLLGPPVVALQVAAFTLGAVIEGFFVPLNEVWTDNSLWLALRDQPVPVGTWLGISLAVGLVVSVVLARRSPRSDT